MSLNYLYKSIYTYITSFVSYKKKYACITRTGIAIKIDFLLTRSQLFHHTLSLTTRLSSNNKTAYCIFKKHINYVPLIYCVKPTTIRFFLGKLKITSEKRDTLYFLSFYRGTILQLNIAIDRFRSYLILGLNTFLNI